MTMARQLQYVGPHGRTIHHTTREGIQMANTKSKGRKGGRNVEKEVQVGRSFVTEGNKVHGTPSNTERSRGGAYAASSVIARGTADQIIANSGDIETRECACGCGQQPSNARSLFMPGHDSKVRAMGKAIKEGRIKETAIPPIAREYLKAGGMLEA